MLIAFLLSLLSPPSSEPASGDPLVARLKGGDEEAFREAVAAYHRRMVRLARSFTKNEATAEEVAQETWLAVLGGLKGFEGRGSFQSWLFSILANRAKTRALRDGRMILFSETSDGLADEPAVDPSRFKASGFWDQPPRPWDDMNPERLAVSGEILSHLRQGLETLPESQRAVVTLRDVEGFSAAETCNILGISETHQRVLLHRGRSRLRNRLEAFL